MKYLLDANVIVVSIFLARLFGPSDFGLIAMVMVIIGIASVFTDVGLGASLKDLGKRWFAFSLYRRGLFEVDRENRRGLI